MNCLFPSIKTWLPDLKVHWIHLCFYTKLRIYCEQGGNYPFLHKLFAKSEEGVVMRAIKHGISSVHLLQSPLSLLVQEAWFKGLIYATFLHCGLLVHSPWSNLSRMLYEKGETVSYFCHAACQTDPKSKLWWVKLPFFLIPEEFWFKVPFCNSLKWGWGAVSLWKQGMSIQSVLCLLLKPRNGLLSVSFSNINVTNTV